MKHAISKNLPVTWICLSVCLYVYLFTGIQAISKNLPVTWISQSCLSICLFIVILHIVRIFQGHGFVFLLVHLFILIHAISKKLPRTQILRSPDLRRLRIDIVRCEPGNISPSCWFMLSVVTLHCQISNGLTPSLNFWLWNLAQLIIQLTTIAVIGEAWSTLISSVRRWSVV